MGPDAGRTYRDWLKAQVEAEPYWFHQIDLGDGLATPGWSNVVSDKLPYFGLPDDCSGMRVLDIGCAEGFFSFEAERRGASEVVAIDAFPDSIRRFNICRSALSSKAVAHEASVYDVDPRSFGTFDLVMYFGVLYHLRHPLLSLQRIASVARGAVLVQTLSFESVGAGDAPVARFLVDGITSGPRDHPMHDPSVFWVPNGACIRDMLVHVGFVNVERVGAAPAQRGTGRVRAAGLKRKLRGGGGATKSRPFGEVGPGVTSAVFRADAPVRTTGTGPDPGAAGIDGAFGGAGGAGIL